jgi:hypothetical protein
MKNLASPVIKFLEKLRQPFPIMGILTEKEGGSLCDSESQLTFLAGREKRLKRCD